MTKSHAVRSCRGFECKQRFVQNLEIREPDPDEEIQLPYVKDGEKNEDQ